MIECLVTEPDALTPAQPVPGFAGLGAGDLDARLAAARPEHHSDLAADLTARARLLRMNRIGRDRADQAMPGAADRLLQLEKIEHGSPDHGPRDLDQRGLDIG